MNRQWAQKNGLFKGDSTATIRTWCRVCGRPAIVEVPLDYGWATEVVHWLDDRQMNHETHHEDGGWGIHWRLDDVLRLIFPEQHHDDFFPTPAWYLHRAINLEPPVFRVAKRHRLDPFL